MPAAVVLCLVAASAGCAHLLGGGGIGRSGPSGWDRELRTLLSGGAHDRALSMVAREESRAGDELLRLQHEGLVAHYAGRWRESSSSLERALAMAEDRYTRSVSKLLLSLVTSDRILPYRPPAPERLLMHYYGALNYLQLGEPDEAAVEARRMGGVLRAAPEGDGDPAVPGAAAGALSYFAGSVFEAAGQANDAGVAYRRARAFGVPAPGSGGDEPAAAGAPAGHGGTAEPESDARPAGDGPPPPGGELLVAVERGFVAPRVQRSLNLFLLPCEVDRLRRIRLSALEDGEEVDAEEALGVARRVAGRNLGWDRGGVGRGGRFRCDGGGDPVLLRVAWPVPGETTAPRGAATVLVDGEERSSSPQVTVDVSGAVRAARRDGRTLELAKSLLRAVTKLAVAEGIEEALSEEDEVLGEVAGWTARLAGVILERADTRSWHTLPARIEMHRLRVAAGEHRVELAASRGGGATRRFPPRRVHVEPGELGVVAVRSWR